MALPARFHRILVVRTDRIGDVLLTTPLFAALRARHADAEIVCLTSPAGAEVVRGNPDVSSVLVDQSAGRGGAGWARVRAELIESDFDLALVASPTLRNALAIRLARIPWRVGTAYRAWSPLLFNVRVRDHRSRGEERHEAEYNLRLLAPLGIPMPSRIEPRIYVDDEDDDEAKAVLTSAGLAPRQTIAALHPGLGGSAPGWPPMHFARLGEMLQREGVRVCLTGSESEKALCEAVAGEMESPAVVLAGRLRLRALAAALSRMHLFVSASTGPMHVAAAVGTPVLAFFSQRRAMSVRRWGPLTPARRVLTAASIRCDACRMGVCASHEDPARISPEAALAAAHDLLAAGRTVEPGLAAVEARR